MCGIVGLLLKNPALREKLGELMAPMLIGMTSRGPDSAGVAFFRPPRGAGRKLSLFWSRGEAGRNDDGAVDWARLSRQLSGQFAGIHTFTETGPHAVLETEAAPLEIRNWLAAAAPQIYVLSVGRSIDLYKDVGAPAEIVRRYGLAHVAGAGA